SNSDWKVWSATETTVMSRIDMIEPSTTTPATIKTERSSLSASGVGRTSPDPPSPGSLWMLVDTTKEYGVAPTGAQPAGARGSAGDGLHCGDDALVFGLHARREAGDGGAVGSDEELLEIPLDVADVAILVRR